MSAAKKQTKESSPSTDKDGLLNRYHAHFAVVFDKSMSWSAERVMAAICEHADDYGIAWPSLDLIAAVSGVARKNVCRALGELRTAGYLKSTHPGTHKSTLHQLTFKGVREWRLHVENARAQRGRMRGLLSEDLSREVLASEDLVSSTGMQSVLPRDAERASLQRPKPTTEPTRNLVGEVVVEGSCGSVPRGTALAAHPEDCDAFASFWSAYPKRQDRRRAKGEWDKQIAVGEAPDAIIRGAERYSRYVREASVPDRYIRFPHTFLAAKEWVNDYEVLNNRRHRKSRQNEHECATAQVSPQPPNGVSPKQRLREERFQQLEAALSEHVRGSTTAERLETLVRHVCRNNQIALEVFGRESLDEVLRDLRMLITQVARGDWGDDAGLPATPEEIPPNEDISIAWLWLKPDTVTGEDVSECLISAARALTPISQPSIRDSEPASENSPEPPREPEADKISRRTRDVVETIARGVRGYRQLADALDITQKQARRVVAQARQQSLLKKNGRWFKPTKH